MLGDSVRLARGARCRALVLALGLTVSCGGGGHESTGGSGGQGGDDTDGSPGIGGVMGGGAGGTPMGGGGSPGGGASGGGNGGGGNAGAVGGGGKGGSAPTPDGGGTAGSGGNTRDAAVTPDASNAGGSVGALGLCSSTGGAAMPMLMKVPAIDKKIPNANQVIGVPGEPGLLYILDHNSGSVWGAIDGKVQADPMAKVAVHTDNVREAGLLSIALHPDFATNQLFYLFYNAAANPTSHLQIDEWKRTSPTTAMFVRGVFAVPHGAPNHNGGMLFFAPDKLLYVSIGDNNTGGGAAKTATGLYGRILRMDPALSGLPIAGTDYTFAYGLRNPYRTTIDRLTHDIYIGDVGQNTTEEVNLNPAGKAGLNWGWTGGTSDGKGSSPETAPIATVATNLGAIIGGFVYRGTKIPGMCGRYFYAHFGEGSVFSFVAEDGKATAKMNHPELTLGSISSFGEDGEGELYMSSNTGTVYKIVAQ